MEPERPLTAVENPPDSFIHLIFPKGPHSTDLTISLNNVDLGQMMIARDHLSIQIEKMVSVTDVPQQGGRGLFIPRNQ